MGTFIVHGGKPLKGEITPQGAKNEALQVICAVLLTSEKNYYKEYSRYQRRKHADRADHLYGR